MSRQFADEFVAVPKELVNCIQCFNIKKLSDETGVSVNNLYSIKNGKKIRMRLYEILALKDFIETYMLPALDVEIKV